MGSFNYRASLDQANTAGTKKTEAETIDKSVKQTTNEAKNIRRGLYIAGGQGLVTPLSTIIGDDEDEPEKGFSSTVEMLKTFFSWNDKYTKEAKPLSTARDPEQITNFLPPPETAAKEGAVPTAEQDSDKYALVMKRRGGPRKNVMDSLIEDQVFLDGIDRLKKDHPDLPIDKFYQIIEGESAGNTDDRNSNSGAVGLWQVTTDALTDLKERDLVPQDLTLAKIRYMDAGQQLDLYSKYLTRWDYDGKMSLALLQGAPSKRKTKSKDTVIFKKGSKATKQNPGWLDANGNATKKSMEAYYGKFASNPLERSLRPVLRPSS
jgi:hypothetical protein